MNKEERQDYILSCLRQNNRIYVTTISQQLNVSDDTLRRDLADLEANGFLTRVHGGAVSRSDTSARIMDRYDQDALAKQKMAEKLVSRFQPGDTLIIDGGTSNLAVAKMLPQNLPLTVFTNSFPLAAELFTHPLHKTVFLGGEVDEEGQVTLGIDTYKSLQMIYADWAIIGVSDLHPTEGLFCIKREEALIKRCMLERCGKRVVMAASEKLDKGRTFQIATLNDIDYIVTDDKGATHILNTWPKGKWSVL